MPACLAVENSPQRLTTQAATETLLGHTRPQWKQHITARPPTGQAGKICGMSGWALALARLIRFQLHRFPRQHGLRYHGFLGHLDFDGPQLLLGALGSLAYLGDTGLDDGLR